MQVSSLQQQQPDNLEQNSFDAALSRSTSSAPASQNAPFVRLRSNPSQPMDNITQIQQPFAIKFSEPLEINRDNMFRPILLDTIKLDTGDAFHTVVTPLSHRNILNLYITDRAKGADLMDNLVSEQPEVASAAKAQINRVRENPVEVFRAKGMGELPVSATDSVDIEPSHVFIHAQKGLTVNKKIENNTLVLTPEFVESFTPFERPATPEATVSRDPSPEPEEAGKPSSSNQ